MAEYSCAICSRVTTYSGGLPSEYPFCSERCRLVDLGKWLRDAYVLERPITPEDLDGEAEPNADR